MFLVALATAKRVGELQALSAKVARSGDDMILSYLPEFVAKTETPSNPIPRSFLLKSIADFAGDLPEERTLCPVRAVAHYLKATGAFPRRSRNLFVGLKDGSRALSKNAISALLRQTISSTDALKEGAQTSLRAHSIRAVSTSLAFKRNCAVSDLLEVATWKSNSVFASFYLRDVAVEWDDCHSLGPFVAAGKVMSNKAACQGRPRRRGKRPCRKGQHPVQSA